MTNEKLFSSIIIYLILHTIIECLWSHYERRVLEEHISDEIRSAKFDLMDRMVDYLQKKLLQEIGTKANMNRELIDDIYKSVMGMGNIFGSLEQLHKRFTKHENHCEKNFNELKALIEPEKEPGPIMVSLDEVIETISKMKKEK